MTTAEFQTGPFFVALTPDEPFYGRLKELKGIVAGIAGEQQYLGDPPHLTLYVGVFASPEPVIAALDAALKEWAPVEIGIAGWHVFRADPLTGRNTIVCDPAAPDIDRLRLLQGRVVDAVSPLRDPAASAQRYRFALENFSPEEAASLERHGYPFVGEIWRPHFTVASIAADRWDAVWPRLENLAPSGPVRCGRITLYAIAEDGPSVVREFRLS